MNDFTMLSADVKETRKVSSTEYVITGDLGSVFKEITALFRRYSAVGYGTRVHSIEAAYPNDGRFEAHVWRSNSCE